MFSATCALVVITLEVFVPPKLWEFLSSPNCGGQGTIDKTSSLLPSPLCSIMGIMVAVVMTAMVLVEVVKEVFSSSLLLCVTPPLPTLVPYLSLSSGKLLAPILFLELRRMSGAA